MRYWLIAVAMMWTMGTAWSQDITVSNVNLRQLPTDMGGMQVLVNFELTGENITADSPAYVFVRYSKDGGDTWQLLSREFFSMGTNDLFISGGSKNIVWWGAEETENFDPEQLQVKVRAIPMQRVAGGPFLMQSEPGQGRHMGEVLTPTSLPTCYVMRYEVTVAQYADYLNEMGKLGRGWNTRMARVERCGITQEGATPNLTYTVAEGRDRYPVIAVSWYDAVAWLQWAGLQMPTEAQWEKSSRGGAHLDGEAGAVANPMPERKYPWGDEKPNADGVFRCNQDGDGDGFEGTAPVGSFVEFNSPYDICDLAGNVSEWTRDWYTTTHHAGLDGFRVLRGGSWMAMSAGVTIITGATQFPIKESSIMGFRGIRE
jgi:formylglycine-generating enzyme required for sulfatase activity